MPGNLDDLASARQRWPKRHDNLLEALQAVFKAWSNCRETEQDNALEQIEGLFMPPGLFFR